MVIWMSMSRVPSSDRYWMIRAFTSGAGALDGLGAAGPPVHPTSVAAMRTRVAPSENPPILTASPLLSRRSISSYPSSGSSTQ